MTLYHGSKDIVEYPEIRKARFNKDFYFGFYCTNIEKQAERWATRYGEKGYINRYEYTENTELKILKFEKMTEEWLDFIISCRSGQAHQYDIVEGPMADDTIYNYLQNYLDGKISTLSAVKQAKENGFVVLYYNTNSKTVWAYSSEEIGGTNQTGKVAIEGEITGIYYNSTDVMTPSSLQLDNDENVQFKLSSSDVQFAFSIYGDYQVGDKIVLICDATTNADGDVSYTVVDYVEY